MDDLSDTIEEKRKDHPDIDELILNHTAKLVSDNHFEYFENNRDNLLKENKNDDKSFSNHIYDTWKDALDTLELFIEIVSESSRIYSNTFGTQAENDDNMLYYAIRTIHARALLISRECLLLLKNGYPNGAFSLWRSIYELSIISDLLYGEHNNDLCKQYIDYYHIQIYNEELSNRNNGYPKYTKKGFKKIEENQKSVINKYGEDFKKVPYGWANSYFNKKKVTFRDLEQKSDLKLLRGYYNSSCNFIHGNHKANCDPMGLIPNTDSYLVIGPSDYGLSIPMQIVAISLLNITAHFIGTYLTVDSSAVCMLLEKYLKRLMKSADSIQKSIEDKNKASN